MDKNRIEKIKSYFILDDEKLDYVNKKDPLLTAKPLFVASLETLNTPKVAEYMKDWTL